jgi:hypothetical protein
MTAAIQRRHAPKWSIIVNYQKNVLALLLAVLFPMTCAVCNPSGTEGGAIGKTPPIGIDGRMTVQKTADKFIILIETVSEPSAFSLDRIVLRDKATGGIYPIYGAYTDRYSCSVEGKFVKIEIYESLLQKAYESVPYTPYLTNLEVRGVMTNEYYYRPENAEMPATTS